MRRAEQGRGLRAVVFVDTVGSTQIAATLGDQRWQTLLRRELQILRQLLKERRGEEVDVAGDGLFALFREPAPAVRFAASAAEAVREIGLEIRAGIHFGEVEFADGRPAGIVVHTGARTMGTGGAGDVIVTGGVRDLLSGGHLAFDGHGTHELKGVPGSWPLFRLTHVDDQLVESPLPDEEADTRRHEKSSPLPLVRRRTFLGGIAAAAVAGSVGTYLLTRDDEPTVSTRGVNAVFRFDPATEDLTILPSRLTAPSAGEGILSCIAVGEGGVWVGGPVLHHIDPRDGAVVANVPVATEGGIPPINDVTTGHDDVWFVDFRAVHRLDPADDELLGSFQFDSPAGGSNTSAPRAVAVGLGAIWVCVEDGSLYRFDGYDELRRPDRIPMGGVPADLLIAADSLWVADEFGRILRVTPRGAIAETIDVGGQPTALTATEDRIWAADPDDLIVIIDPRQRRSPEHIAVEGHLVDIAAGLEAVWVADHGGDLIKLDPSLREIVTRTRVGGPISALAVDEELGVVWVRTAPAHSR
jgi:class 3 adenylate cyclase/streptogramin lyase